MTSTATFQWTNDEHMQDCKSRMQYVRVYIDYIPYNQDMMVSLALMNPESENFVFFFSCQLSIFLTVIYHHKYIISCYVFPRGFWLVPSEIGIELDVAGVM